MKNKLLLSACLLYLFSIALQAAPVTANEAKRQAAVFSCPTVKHRQTYHIACGKPAAHAHLGIHEQVGQQRSLLLCIQQE